MRYLANLAATFGHGCTPAQRVDVEDMEHLSPAERRLLAPDQAGNTLMVPTASTAPNPTVVVLSGTRAHPELRLAHRRTDTVTSLGSRRIVRCDAHGLPIHKEVVMVAEESARFRRWSATTNVDDDVLEQVETDVAEIALRYLIDPPATVFSRLIGARDDVFTLIWCSWVRSVGRSLSGARSTAQTQRT